MATASADTSATPARVSAAHATAAAAFRLRPCFVHYVFFFQAEDGIRDVAVTGVQTCALPIFGNAVAVELSIQGTFLGPLETPAGIVQPTGAKVDIPCADFWYLRDRKIEKFDC